MYIQDPLYIRGIGNDNTVKERIIVTDFLPVEDIRAGRFTVPELKKLSDDDYDKVVDSNTSNGFVEVPADLDDDLPF